MNINRYTLQLKVCKPDGAPFFAEITQVDKEKNRVTIRECDSLVGDGWETDKKGSFSKVYRRSMHVRVIDTLTQYLETLMLKELAHENNHTSL